MKRRKFIIVIILLLGSISLITGFYINKAIVNKEEEKNSHSNPKIEIVIKNNKRNKRNEIFYETDLINYELQNRKKDDIYIRFNKKEEFSLSKIMQNNDTNYAVNPKKILRLLLDNNINYIVSSKYEFIDIGAMLPKNLKEDEINIEVTNSNKKAINTILGHDGSLSKESIYRKILYIICKKNGESIINIKVSNNKTKETIINKKFKALATINNHIYNVKYFEI